MENNQSLEFRTENLEREIVVLRKTIEALITDRLESAGEFERRLFESQQAFARIVIDKFAEIEGRTASPITEKSNDGTTPALH